MALLTYREQLALSGVWVIYAQCEIRASREVLYVVYNIASLVSSMCFAYLTLVIIQPTDIRTKLAP